MQGPDPERPGEAEGKIEPGRIVAILDSYKNEAETNRKTGHAARDDVWESNWKLYWSQYDFSLKAPWQAKEKPPEAAAFVDRWSALLAEALIQPGEWYGLKAPHGLEELEPVIRRVMDAWLARCGRSAQGHELGFPAVFEAIVKNGAMTAGCAMVSWKEEVDGPGYVAVEALDAREVWLDHTGRNLYRRRRLEFDLHDLKEMAEGEFEGGSPFNREEIARLTAQLSQDRQNERELSTGHGQDQSSRLTVTVDEWLCDLVDPATGEVLGRQVWCMVANDQALILGPVPNPFWHGQDWVVFTPFVLVDGSVYGRSYMDSWASTAKTFTFLTNLVLDGAQLSIARMVGLVSDALKDPSQLQDGVFPGKVLEIEDGFSVADVMRTLEIGALPPEVFQTWGAVRQELREGALLNEIALGQLAPKGETTATEIDRTSQSSVSQVRAMARTLEERQLEPVLDQVWSNGLQHTDFEHPAVISEIGAEAAAMLGSRRDEFRARGIRFRAFGLSGLIDRSQRLRKLMAMIQTVMQNEVLAQQFMERYPRILDEMVRLYGIDLTGAAAGPMDAMIQGAARAQAQGPGPQQTNGAGRVGSPPDVANALVSLTQPGGQ